MLVDFGEHQWSRCQIGLILTVVLDCHIDSVVVHVMEHDPACCCIMPAAAAVLGCECRSDVSLAHAQTSAQDAQRSAQGGVYRRVASVSRGVLRSSRWSERLSPSDWDEQEDLPCWTGLHLSLHCLFTCFFLLICLI